MAAKYKRKADDREIVALNNVGLSLSGIGQLLDVHHTTVKYRLKELGIAPADTRRAFMEDIYRGLSAAQQSWLVDQLAAGYSVKDFIRTLLIEKYIDRAAPVSATGL